MKNILIGIFAIYTISAQAAGCNTTGCYNVNIDKLFVTNTGTIYVGTSGDESSLTCGALGGTYIILPTGTAQNQLYSMLLTAQTTKRPVNIKVSDGTYCPIAYMYN